LSDSSDLFDLADCGVGLSFDLLIVEVPGLDSFTESFSEVLELAEEDLELLFDSESYFGELALESLADFRELAELTLELVLATSGNSLLDFDEVGLDSVSELDELSLDSFPDFKELRLELDFESLAELFLELAFDCVLFAVPGRDAFSDPELGLEGFSESYFAELALDDFEVNKFGEAPRSLLAVSLLFAVPGRDSLSDSSEEESLLSLLVDSFFAVAELALEDFAEVCFEEVSFESSSLSAFELINAEDLLS